MAFRRRPIGRRRFRRRWDMQTHRECEVSLPWEPDVIADCTTPQTFATYVCGIGPSTATQMKGGASRSVTFGGGHLQLRYNAAIFNSSDMPCGLALKVISALVVLPLSEDEVTPAYLPNLAVARTQLSVLPITQSDTDEDIVWWRDFQLDLLNTTCTGIPPGGGDPALCTPANACGLADDLQPLLWVAVGNAAAMYGRAEFNVEVRAKRRLKERQALYLVTHYVSLSQYPGAAQGWEIRRNVYFRYAVR